MPHSLVLSLLGFRQRRARGSWAASEVHKRGRLPLLPQCAPQASRRHAQPFVWAMLQPTQQRPRQLRRGLAQVIPAALLLATPVHGHRAPSRRSMM